MLSTELHGLTISCQSDEFAVFDPPSGQTCMAWYISSVNSSITYSQFHKNFRASEFVNSFGGYIDNPNATQACRYCPYTVRISHEGLPLVTDDGDP